MATGSGTGTVASASSYPITLAEAKAHLRVDHDDEDTLITSLIGASTEYAQNFTKRQFINATKTLKLDAFPTGYISLPFPPLGSVTSITYVDTAGDSQTWASSNYVVDTQNEPGRVTLAYQATYPNTRTIEQAVTITYVAGYGADGSSTPEGIKQAILLMVGAWYENREEETSGLVVREIPIGAERLLGMYTIQSLH